MEIDIFQVPGIIKRRVHYIVLSVIACIALATLYMSTVVPLYRANTEILLDPQGLMADRRDLFLSGAAPPEQSSLDSQIYIVLSRDVMTRVINTLSLAEDPYLAKAAKVPEGASNDARNAALTAVLLKHVKAERAGQSFVMQITAEHPDAVRAALIANEVARTYLTTIANSRSEATRRASESFQEQATELRDRVLQAELAVEDFKKQNGLVTTGERGLLIDQQVSGINEQLTQARLAEEQQKASYDQVRSLTISAIESGAIPEVAQSQSIEPLRQRYTQLLEREAELAAGLGTSHPQMRAVRSQIAGARQSLDAEIARLRESMRASYERAAANTKAISEQLSRVTRSSYDSSEAMTRMRQLESEADAIRTIYKTFLNRAEELGQTQGVNTNNSHVISEAAPPAATPSGLKKIVLIAAALFGIALGSGLAVLRELLGQVFKRSPSKQIVATHGLGLPVIATLPAQVSSRQGGLARLAGVFNRNKKPDGQDEYHRKHELGMLRSVHYLLNTFGDNRPASILFVSPGERQPSVAFVTAAAETLVDLRQTVAFADGNLQGPNTAFAKPGKRHRPSAGGILALRVEEEPQQVDFPLADRLVYTHLPETANDRFRAHRTDFILIDACGTQAVELLPELIAQSDALIVIRDETLVTRKETEELIESLGQWKEKLAGQIIIGGNT